MRISFAKKVLIKSAVNFSMAVGMSLFLVPSLIGGSAGAFFAWLFISSDLIVAGVNIMLITALLEFSRSLFFRRYCERQCILFLADLKWNAILNLLFEPDQELEKAQQASLVIFY